MLEYGIATLGCNENYTVTATFAARCYIIRNSTTLSIAYFALSLSTDIDLNVVAVVHLRKRDLNLLSDWLALLRSLLLLTVATAVEDVKDRSERAHTTHAAHLVRLLHSLEAIAIVQLALLVVLQDFIGITYLLEFLLVLRYIGIVFLGELKVCFFNLRRACVWFNAEDLV